MNENNSDTEAANALLDLNKSSLEAQSFEEIAAAGAAKTSNKRKRVRVKKVNSITNLMKPPFGYFLMPNSDVRYSYPSQIFPALTSYNFESFRDKMKELCEPTVQFIQEYNGEVNPLGPNKRHVVGIDSLIEMAQLIATAAPDCINAREIPVGHICEASGEVYLNFNGRSKATMLCHVVENPPPPSHPCTSDLMNQIMGTTAGSSSSTSHQRTHSFAATLDSLNTSFQSFSLQPRIAPVPTSHYSGKWCLIINKEMRIHTVYHFFSIVTEFPAASKTTTASESSANNNSNNSSSSSKSNIVHNIASVIEIDNDEDNDDGFDDDEETILDAPVTVVAGVVSVTDTNSDV